MPRVRKNRIPIILSNKEKELPYSDFKLLKEKLRKTIGRSEAHQYNVVAGKSAIEPHLYIPITKLLKCEMVDLLPKPKKQKARA
jgi:hypothetical protein